jgi:CheY-like chemotaxis protein
MDQKPTVLLAEDEPADVFLIERAVRKMQFPVSLQVAKNGEEAIAYLSGEREFSNRERFPIPALLLLDIKMPRKTGFDVLEWLKYNGSFAHMPVVMVTSSAIKSDIEKAHDLGASGYLVKPVPFDQLQRLFTETPEFLAECAATLQ